jgi:hypothetical protein
MALGAAAGLVLVACLGWAGWNLAPAMKASEAELRTAHQVNALDHEHNEIIKSLPSFGVQGTTMRDAVAFYNSAVRGFPTLPAFLAPISNVLRAYPSMRLTQVAWIATDDAKATPKLARTQGRDVPPVRAIAKASGEPAAPAGPAPVEDPPNPPFAGGRYQVALIEGSLRVNANDFRGATAEVEKLAADIGRIEGFRADVAEGPLDVSPNKQLQGRLTDRLPPTMETRFVLRVVRQKEAAG